MVASVRGRDERPTAVAQNRKDCHNAISPHAWEEMADDQMTVQDVYQVLRGGVAEPGEYRQDS
jgi:hypothetical protein